MADVLIRGMEMPPKGKSICIEIFGAGGVHKFGECYPCALAYDVKTPHGRLIDAEAFEDAFIRYYLSQERNNHLVFTPVEIKQHLADMIGDWPTIVPAEGGNADG